MTTTLGIQEAVRFVGYLRDVRDWLAVADISVLPSFYEGLPGAPIESLAAGRPVVATAVDGTPEIVIDGQTGLTVPPGDPNSLAKAVCRILGDPGLGRVLARKGREWVLANFGVERLVQCTERLYLDAWKKRREVKTQRVPRSSHVAHGSAGRNT